MGRDHVEPRIFMPELAPKLKAFNPRVKPVCYQEIVLSPGTFIRSIFGDYRALGSPELDQRTCKMSSGDEDATHRESNLGLPPRHLDTSPGNYAELTRHMSTCPESAIFQRFQHLNLLNLFRIQAELQYLHDQLEDIRKEDSEAGDAIRSAYITDFRLMLD